MGKVKKEAKAEGQVVEEIASGDLVGLTLRHKSHTPCYHRCGLCITRMWKEYEVTVEKALLIKADKWIEIKGDDE